MALILCLIFFLSGASALLFETLWFRLAGLTFGNSVWASSLVLSSFMAGLGLGNALAARYGSRLQRPVRAYAILEAVIGATGFGLVLLYPLLTPLLVPLLRPFLDTPSILNALRLTLTFLLMLLPSTAMGATLPILVRTLTATNPHFGRALGRLYGWNTLGAVAGALLGEGLLLGLVGVRGTGLTAAFLNFFVALVGVTLSRSRAFRQPSTTVATDAKKRVLSPVGRWLLGGAALAGGILLALEVVWFRFLQLFLTATSLTFAVMLSMVLLGIASGGFLASWWLRARPNAYRSLPQLALVSGSMCALVYLWFGQLPGEIAVLVAGSLRLVFAMSLWLMFPVCLLSGILFTFFGAALNEVLGEATRTTGLLTLANTVGATLGAALAGFVLLPGLGMERSFCTLAVTYSGVALCAMAALPATERRPWRSLTLGVPLAAYAASLVFFPFGLMRNHYIPSVAARYAKDGSRIVAVREGLAETIIYLRKTAWGEPLYHRLLTNAFSMSATHYWSRRYMKFFVYWPIALHPEAKNALLISYGVGSTAKALTDTSGLDSIDVVDISPEILEMSRIVFPTHEADPINDPRVRVYVEDGRFFLLMTDRRYDIITAEPPPPKLAGVVNLYSLEYFQLLHDRLAEGGIVTYWLPVYQLEEAQSKAVIRAFCSAFDDCSLWTGAGFEWMLAGTRGARGPLRAEEFDRQWRDPRVLPELQTLGFETPEQVGALFIADAPFLRKLTRNQPPLVDNYPLRLAHGAGAGHELAYVDLMDVRRTRERFATSALIERLWPRSTREATLEHFDYQEIVTANAFDDYDVTRLQRALSESTLRTPLLWLLGTDEDELRVAKQALRRGARGPRLFFTLGAGAIVERDYAKAVRYLEMVPEEVRSLRCVQNLVLALCMAGDKQRAGRVAREARSSDGEFLGPEFMSWFEESCDLAAGQRIPSVESPRHGRAPGAGLPGG